MRGWKCWRKYFWNVTFNRCENKKKFWQLQKGKNKVLSLCWCQHFSSSCLNLNPERDHPYLRLNPHNPGWFSTLMTAGLTVMPRDFWKQKIAQMSGKDRYSKVTKGFLAHTCDLFGRSWSDAHWRKQMTRRERETERKSEVTFVDISTSSFLLE